MDQDKIPGDEDFERFIDSQEPSNSLNFLLMISLREKMKSLNEFYRTSLELYPKMSDDSLKSETAEFIKGIMKEILETNQQFNVFMASQIMEDEDYEDEDEQD